MTILAKVPRILLGLLFVLAGAAAFFIRNAPPQPGPAGAFNTIFIHSHWSLFVGAVQLAIGMLFLANRFVVVALIMLAAFLYNSFAFHITMAPSGLPAPILVLALGVAVSLQHRPAFAALLAEDAHVGPTP